LKKQYFVLLNVESVVTFLERLLMTYWKESFSSNIFFRKRASDYFDFRCWKRNVTAFWRTSRLATLQLRTFLDSELYCIIATRPLQLLALNETRITREALYRRQFSSQTDDETRKVFFRFELLLQTRRSAWKDFWATKPPSLLRGHFHGEE
jgi:hypothetical protein